jgi:hypothetical protein
MRWDGHLTLAIQHQDTLPALELPVLLLLRNTTT